MQDKIDIATSSGVSGALTHATLDTKNQIIRSHRPVSFVLPNGTVRANALTFYSAKHTLTFRGKVAVHIVRPKKEAKPRPRPQPAAAADVPRRRRRVPPASRPCLRCRAPPAGKLAPAAGERSRRRPERLVPGMTGALPQTCAALLRCVRMSA